MIFRMGLTAFVSLRNTPVFTTFTFLEVAEDTGGVSTPIAVILLKAEDTDVKKEDSIPQLKTRCILLNKAGQ